MNAVSAEKEEPGLELENVFLFINILVSYNHNHSTFECILGEKEYCAVKLTTSQRPLLVGLKVKLWKALYYSQAVYFLVLLAFSVSRVNSLL